MIHSYRQTAICIAVSVACGLAAQSASAQTAGATLSEVHVDARGTGWFLVARLPGAPKY